MLDGAFSWPRTHPRGRDLLFTVLVAVVVGVPSVVITLISLSGPRVAVVLSGVVIVHVAVLVNRTRPVTCFAVVAVGVVIMMAGTRFFVLVPSVLVLPLAMYSLAGYGSPRAARIGLGVSLAGVAVAAVRTAVEPLPGLPMPAPLFLCALAAAVVTLAWVGGLFRRTRQAELALLAERLRHAEREEHSRAAEARLAERTRIAREFHDIVAHSLAVIVNLAKGARYAATADPEQVDPALTSIENTSRSALNELRGLVQVLKYPDVSYQPTPGLDDVPKLVDATAAAGLPVELEQRGDPWPVGAAVGLAVYRLVQEALTNVIKHAGPAAVTRVRLAWSPRSLRVEVRNAAPESTKDDTPPVQVSFGVGLAGVVGRVTAVSGQCRYGPDGAGGYVVRADIPDTQEPSPT